MTHAYTWTPVIVAHTAAAVAALLLGAFSLLSRKGSPAHRRAGWLWVALMATVAGTSFAIFRERYSWIHALSVFSLVMLVLGVAHARAHRVRHHRGTMIGLYFGALVVTGLFTLLPHRLLGHALRSAWPWS
jgi:uncharacterized membrane protein